VQLLYVHDSLIYSCCYSCRGSYFAATADSQGMGGGIGSAGRFEGYQRQRMALFEAL
jgi:hypothetical protein